MNGGAKRPASTKPSAEDNSVKTAKLDLNSGGGGKNTTMHGDIIQKSSGNYPA
jgi:hypothetical protein